MSRLCFLMEAFVAQEVLKTQELTASDLLHLAKKVITTYFLFTLMVVVCAVIPVVIALAFGLLH